MKVLKFTEFVNENLLNESVTSELHYLAKLASDADDFVKRAIDELVELKNDQKTRKYLVDMYHDLIIESLLEASRSKVFKAAKTGSYPATIVVVEKGKVVHQETVTTPEVTPATFNVIQTKYPTATIHLEDSTGKRLLSESLITEKKSILSSDEESDFVEWIEDGNAMLKKNGKWIEQTTQWRKEFTFDELKKFFKREYLNENKVEKSDDDPCWDGYVQLGTKDKDGKEVPNCVTIDEIKESEHLFEGEPIVPILQKMAKSSENINDFIEKAFVRFKNKLKDGKLNREWLKGIYKESI